MEEKELFEDYELKGWQLTPRLYKILGASVLAHLLFFGISAQFNLLSAKACDSPYVSKVCQVLDATYLATIFLGEDTSFVNRDYEKTEIADADITFIDVSQAAPPFQYPEGYFAVANPEMAMNQQMMSEYGDFSSTSPSELDLNAPQVLPTPNNDVANQPLPDSPFSFGNDTKPAPPVKQSRVPAYRPPRARTPVARQTKPKNESPSALPKLDGEETADNANANQTVAGNKTENANKPPVEIAEEDKDKFNQRPLKEWGARYGDQILSKDININAPFTIEVIAGLAEDGKLVKPVMKSAPNSDPKMTELAKEAIAAFGDSHLLRPLYAVGARNIKITFTQNADNLQAIIQTEAPNELRANVLSSALNAYIKSNKPKEGSDEAVLMSKAQFTTQGKVFIINFLISNEEKNQMIEKNLKNLKQEQEKVGQPNGLAENKNKSTKV
jgi:hypothetical protein